MPLKNLKYYLLFICLYSVKIFSQQEVARYPIRFAQYYNCYPLLNPASAGAYNNYEFALGTQKLLGSFNNVSTSYFNANFRLNSRAASKNKPFSVLGALFYNDSEGRYINRARFYLTYAWHGNIFENVLMSGGFHFGGMNYSVKGTDASYKASLAIKSGSDIVPDGAIGFRFYNKKFLVGISYNQMLNSQVQPIEEIAQLSPFLNLTGSLNIKLSELLIFEPKYALKVPVNGDKLLTDITFIAAYKNTMRFIVGIHDNDKMVNSFEFRNILAESNGPALCFSYSYPITSGGLSTRSIEVGLVFGLDSFVFK